jgi:hypothetical protein
MTNPMTTTGDTIYSSSGSTPARLGIGSTGQVLTVAGGVPTWATPAGGGKVLQVVNANTTTTVDLATSTFTDTTLTATITPTSATSKILVLVSQNGIHKFGANAYMSLILLRGATNILTFEDQVLKTDNTNTNNVGSVSCNFLDSPATTSATTYKTQFKSPSNIGDIAVQRGSAASTITLLEIGA